MIFLYCKRCRYKLQAFVDLIFQTPVSGAEFLQEFRFGKFAGDLLMWNIFQILLPLSFLFLPFMGSDFDGIHIRFKGRLSCGGGFCLIEAFCIHDCKLQLIIGFIRKKLFLCGSAKPVCLCKIPFFNDKLHLLIGTFQFSCQF